MSKIDITKPLQLDDGTPVEFIDVFPRGWGAHWEGYLQAASSAQEADDFCFAEERITRLKVTSVSGVQISVEIV